MCGICGAVALTNITVSEVTKVQKLLKLNHFRGNDSSGMFDYVKLAEQPKGIIQKIKNRGKLSKKPPVTETHYWKTINEPYWFATRIIPQVFSERWEPNILRMVCCHARAATVGAVTKENAHPFRYENIVGVHNGTITGDFDGKKDCDVDSQALFMNIQKHGPEKAISEITERAGTVAYALVWIDTKINKAYFLRNIQRPLCHYTTAGTTFFTSDKKDMVYAFGLLSDLQVKEFEPEVLYSLDLNGKENEFTQEKLNIKRKTYNFNGHGHNTTPWTERGWGNSEGTDFWGDFTGNGYSHENEKSDVTPETKSGNNVLTMRPKLSDYDKRAYENIWKQKTFDEMKRCGTERKTLGCPHYDIATGKWYSAHNFPMFQMWKADNKTQYSFELNKAVQYFSKTTIKAELDKCTFPPLELVNKGKNAVIHLPDKPEKEKESEKDLTIPFGVSGRKCSEEMYRKKLNDGCAFCSDPIDEQDPVFWVDDTKPLCSICQYTAIGDPHHLINEMVDVRLVEAFLEDFTKSSIIN